MTEDKLQQSIFVYFNNKYCLKHQKPQYCIFAVPNGGSRNPIEAKKLKATGVRAGVSDLIVLMQNKCIFFELKTEFGKQQETQKDFESTVTNLGFKYYIVRSLEQFKQIIDNEQNQN